MTEIIVKIGTRLLKKLCDIAENGWATGNYVGQKTVEDCIDKAIFEFTEKYWKKESE